MQLIERLERAIDGEESPFRRQLLAEDVARLRKLQELARATPDLAEFIQAGMRIGWTQGDQRTHEIRAPLESLLQNVFALETGTGDAAAQGLVEQAWTEMHRARMERLLGCLSTPAPKPAA